MERDQGARKLVELFFSVAGVLVLFYSILAYRSLTWSPMFFIKNTDSDRSKVSFVADESEVTSGAVSSGAAWSALGAAASVQAYDSADLTHAFRGSFVSPVERGKKSYLRVGCALCHGLGGRGGVRNPNAKGGEVPALSKLADTIVNDKTQADRLVTLLQQGAPLDEHEPWLGEFFKIKKSIREGKTSLKENPNEPAPPLTMPKWGQKLSDKQIEELIAYVITLFPEDKWESWDEPAGKSPK